MKFIYSLLFILPFSLVSAQITLLDEGFESYTDFSINNFGGWKTLDIDQLSTYTLGGDPAPPTNWFATWPNAGAKMAYQIFNPSMSNATNDATGITGEIRNFDPHSGLKYAGCWAGRMIETGNGNKDWLISPSVTLGTSGNQLTLWLKTLSTSYGDEKYRIGIYTGNGVPTSSNEFTIISGNTSPTEPFLYAHANWQQNTYNLDAFSGQTIRVGIFCLTQEGSMLMIDDVKITSANTSLSSQENILKNKLKVFPNPTKAQINIKSINKIIDIEIYNSIGIKLKTTKYSTFDFSNYNNGIYFLKINYENNNSETIQVLKE